MDEERAPAPFLSDQEIADWPAAPPPASGADLSAPLQAKLDRHGQMTRYQVAARNFPMGCTNLEITQRCNLDCTLCYLSDNAEAIRDIPMAEVLRRIQMIRDHYGAGTNVQISGGDPTLRDPDELVAICAAIKRKHMTPSLLTNGIKATRPLLSRLAKAGLADVVFHVDLTQERRGYATEADLNAIRRDYIARAKGLGLRILFNTTVCDANVAQMPDLVRFFLAEIRHIHMVSFQMQAEQGRGVLRARPDSVSVARMLDDIRTVTGLDLAFDMPQIGHSRCNRYATILAAGPSRIPLYEPKDLFVKLLRAAEAENDAWRARRPLLGIARVIAKNPLLILRALPEPLRAAWRLRHGLIRTGRVDKLSFFVHNFMSADMLERDRCESCIFMAATKDGPMSMCVYNAKREAMLAEKIQTPDGLWDPVLKTVPKKRLKGRTRQAQPSG